MDARPRGSVRAGFRTGWRACGWASQGGHAALATQRALERKPIADLAVRATAAAAAPYDLAAISFPVALRGGAKSHRVYLGYLVYTYARIYGRSRSSVLRSPYDKRVEVLLDVG